MVIINAIMGLKGGKAEAQLGVCGGVLMILYFSATGNSKYAAERIAANTNDHAVSIEKNLIIK
jgi:hypothetical protein